MKHFVCTGDCGGESNVPGVCHGEGCKKEGEPLLPCACENDLHEGVEVKEPEDTE